MAEVEKIGDDTNKKLYYTTALLEIVNGRFRCFVCDHSTLQSGAMVNHITAIHPKFIHKTASGRTSRGAKVPDEFSTPTKEDLSDPNKKLFYSTSNLGIVDGKYQCLCCDYGSPYSSNLIRHISRRHLHLIHKPVKQARDFCSKSYENTPDVVAVNLKNNIEKSENKMKRRTANSPPAQTLHKRSSLRNIESIDYTEIQHDGGRSSDDDGHSEDITMEIYDQLGLNFNKHPSNDTVAAISHSSVLDPTNYSLKERSNDFSDERSIGRLLTRVQNPTEDNTTLVLQNVNSVLMSIHNESKRRSSANCNTYCEMDGQCLDKDSTSILDLIGMNLFENRGELIDMEKNRKILDESLEDNDNLLRKLQTEDTTFLTVTREKEIDTLKEELNERKEVDMKQLLLVKEELEKEKNGAHSTTYWGVPELLRQLEAERKKVNDLKAVISNKDNEFENFKTQNEEMRKNFQSEYEKAKTREEEWTKKNFVFLSKTAELRKQLEEEREKVADMENKLISRRVEYSNLKSIHEEMRQQLECESEKLEEEFAKRMAEAESKLKECEKVLELRDKKGKLKLQQEREVQMLKEAERALEEGKRV